MAKLSKITQRMSTMQKRRLLKRIWPRYLYTLDVLNANARVYEWHKRHSTGLPKFETREQYHAYVAGQVGGAVQYLEFGVANGTSLRWWLDRNGNPESRFVGFDTFAGLPEDWSFFLGATPKGTFDRGGIPPQIEDARCNLVVGLFQDTLVPFVENFNPTGRLVIHIDSDLYSSALFVLTTMHQLIAQYGAIVMFDDFWNPTHDFRAFNDYRSAFGGSWTLFAGTDFDDFRCVAFEVAATR